jgi:pSer/pThr/pTyr-binding forkhead associated (FHA) protein
MAGLVVEVLFKGRVLQVVPFERGTLRIGRMRENEIVIDNLSVSRFHARLQLVDGRVFLDDNGSENGTFVSGARVHGRVEINPGDAIAVGKHQLRVRSELGNVQAAAPAPPPASDAWDPAKTYVAGPEARAQLLAEAQQRPPATPPAVGRAAEAADPAAAAAAPRSEEPPAMRDEKPARPDAAAIELGRVGDAVFDLASPDADEPVELAPEPDDALAAPAVAATHVPAAAQAPASTATLEIAAPSEAAPLYAGLIVQREGRIERVVPWSEELLTVGRSADCDLVLGQDEVSRRHAQLRRSGERYEVHDLGSVNGTLVNGHRVDRRILEVGDVIQIEGYQLTFVIDREPLDGVMKPASAPALAGARPEDPFAVTILQGELQQQPSGFEEPIAAVAEAPRAAAPADGEVELLEGVELEEVPDAPIDERKELASAQPRGSSRASSVQDLGRVEAPPRAVTLELRLSLEELPEPLRRAFAELEPEGIALPAELRLRASKASR